ncbi:MAG: 30S ribosomal protein S20 [Clostridiales bacterium]|nr:30S ribosomal protein S20 [Clostridiales bacterium]
MPNTKSAKKRMRVSARQNAENVSKKSRVKNAIKKFNASIAAKDIALAESLLPETVSIIDRAKSDGVYHKNTAARKIASISRSLSNLKAENN